MTKETVSDLQRFVPLYKQGSVTAAFVAAELDISERHAYRLLRHGVDTVQRIAPGKLSDEIREFIAESKEEHPSRNCQWISELASDRFGRGISQPSVWRILKSSGLLDEKSPTRIARSRFEAKACGDLVQMDTTWGYWWKGTKICLILLLDDHSRYILNYKWVTSDSAGNNMALIAETVEKYGVFRSLYTDNASFFKAIRHNRSRHQAHASEEYETDIGRSCREAGILHLTHKPYQPQGKGKIERLFRFIQERFITTVEEDPSMEWPDFLALFDSWVQWYNTSHVNRTTGCTPKERFNPHGFSPLPAETNLADVFCWKHTRKVDSCNQFSFEGSRYTIPPKSCMVAYRVDLHVTPQQHIRVWHNGVYMCQLPIQKKSN